MKKTWQKWAVAFVATFGLSNVALADDVMERYAEALAEAHSYCSNHSDSKLCSGNEETHKNLCNSKSNNQEAAFACVLASAEVAKSGNGKLIDYAYKACEKRMANPSLSKKLSAGCDLTIAYFFAGANGDANLSRDAGANMCRNKNDAYFKKFVSSVKEVNSNSELTVKMMRELCGLYKKLN